MVSVDQQTLLTSKQDHAADEKTASDNTSEDFLDTSTPITAEFHRLHAAAESRQSAPPATMDIFVNSAYRCSMIARLFTMLAILAITVVTTVTSAHAARMSMSAGPDHAMHVGEMMHSTDVVDLACDAGQHCGSADAEMCEFMCAGLSTFLTSAGGEAGHQPESASHDLPSKAIHVSRAPGQNERPPKLRLL